MYTSEGTGTKRGEKISNASRRRTWEERYADLRAFFEEQGHSSPKTANTLVGQWATKQRIKRRHGELSDEKIELLNEIQYDWESRGQKLNKQWEKMFNLLKMYKLEFGHMGVTQKEVYHGEGLGKWVPRQQSYY